MIKRYTLTSLSNTISKIIVCLFFIVCLSLALNKLDKFTEFNMGFKTPLFEFHFGGKLKE